MNYIHVRTYKDIGLFQSTENNIIYIVSNSNRSNIFRISKDDSVNIFKDKDKILKIYKEKNSIWFITQTGTLGYTPNKTLNIINNLWFQQSIKIPFYLFIKKNIKDQDCFCLYDIKNKKIIWEIIYGATTYLATKRYLCLALSNKTIVKCYSYISPNEIWEYDISQIGRYTPSLENVEVKGKVYKIIGIFKKELIILLKGGAFISLDIETGILLWKKSNVDFNKTKHKINFGFGDPFFPFYNEEKGEIYILQGRHFILFDLNTRTASYEWCTDENKDGDILYIHDSGIYNNKIHFIASPYTYATYNIIGIFDISVKKVIWSYKFELNKYNNIRETQMNDTHFYALDKENNLYTFRKE